MLFWANKSSLLKVRYYAFISNEKKTFTFYIQIQFFYFSYMTAIMRGDWKYLF